MRKLTKNHDIFKIRDKIVKAYLKLILRRFKRLNQGFITGFDEINILSAVNAVYDDVIDLTVEALKKIARQTYFWICEDDFPMDMWLAETTGLSRSEIIDRMLSGMMDSFVAEFLQQFDPVTHYKFYDEADRKRSSTYEAVMSSLSVSDRKKQIEIATKKWAKQFEQVADNLVEATLKKAYQDNNVKYVKWMTMRDAKVCSDCYAKQGKIYPITSPLLRPLHWNCRCWWIPVKM